MHLALSTSAQKVIGHAFGIQGAVVEWRPTEDGAHGDITTTAALRLAKQAGKNPREIAQVIADGLNASGEVQKAEVAGAGYVNVWLRPAALFDALKDVQASIAPTPTRSKEAPVIVEYSQPNIAKPLGAHHIIGTVLGQAVSNLYEHAGYPVIRWNYLGDWGTQFGKLAVAFRNWGSGKPASAYTIDELLDLYVRFHTEAEANPALEDEGRATSLRLERGDPELRAFWEDVVAVTKSTLEQIYKRLAVSFDLDKGESFYEDKMDSVLEEGRKKGVFTEGEKGALIVQFPEESKLPPYVILRGDGATLYSTRDLAQMRYRIETYHPQAILIFTDVAQMLHFQQLEATCRMLGWELPTFENVLFGRMSFVDKAMSTRKGNILKLEHVLDEAVERAAEVIKDRGDAIQTDDPADLAEMMGVGAIIYGILSQNRKMDITFDWDRMLSFEGNSAPYLQYTHARARSVLRKADGDAGSLAADAPFSERDRILIRMLLQYPAVLEEARSEHMPHKLTNYLYALCQEFNGFYNAEPILKAEDAAVRRLRLGLTDLVASVLRSGAALLCLRLPDRM